MAVNAVIGALRVNLGIDTAAFHTGLTKAEIRAEKFGRAIGTALRAGAIAAAAGLAAVAVAIRKTITEADELGKMAQSIGIPVEELSRLKHAADLSGLSLEGLGTAVGRLSRNMSDVAAGAGAEAARAFDRLGISVKRADGTLKSSSEVMAEVADRFQKMPDGAQKTALAMQLMGRSGATMIPLLNGGAAALRSMMEEADRLGIVIDERTAKAAERFNDNLTRLRTVFDGIMVQVASRLLPALERLSEVFVQVAVDGGKIDAMANAITSALKFVVREVASAVLLFQRLGAELNALHVFLSTDFFSGQWSENWNKFLAEGEKTEQMFANLNTEIDRVFSNGITMAERFDVAFGAAGAKAGQVTDRMAAVADSVDNVSSRVSSLGPPIRAAESTFEGMGNTLQSSLSGVFDSIVEGSFNAREAIGSLLKSLAKLFINNAIQSLFGGFFGGGGAMLGRIGAGGIPIPGINPLLGFAGGGSFTVGGSGGIDSQLVQFRATPGEHVTVSKGDKPASVVETTSINVTVNGARGNKEIQEMVFAGVQAGIAQDRRMSARRQETSGQ